MWPWALACALGVLGVGIIGFGARDDGAAITEQPRVIGDLRVYVDKATGCEYVRPRGSRAALTQRMGADGRQVCHGL
jgi:hypothetical protein